MISIDCKFFNNVIIDGKNQVAVFFATNKEVFSEVLNIVFDVLYHKTYGIQSKIIKVVKLTENYCYFDYDNQYIHYFQKIPEEGKDTEEWIQKILPKN